MTLASCIPKKVSLVSYPECLFLKKMENSPRTLMNKMTYLLMYSLSQLFTRHNIFLCQPVTPKDYTQTSASIPFLLLLWQASPEVLHSLACQCPSKFFPANLGMSVLMLEFILPHANSPSSFCHPRTHEKGSINGVKICVVTARINYSFYQNEANGDYM